MKVSPEKAAVAAGLCYVHDGMPGICRQRWGKGFSYILPNGDRLPSSPKCGSSEAAVRDRIEALVIPPNWEDVWICLNPKGHLQATGRDGKGRKQYRYHPDWRKFRNLQKFDKMVPFGECLPELRWRSPSKGGSQTAADLKVSKLSRRKVTAAAVQLLDRTLIRVGTAQYAQRNKSYGLTTLRDRHVDIDSGQLNFHTWAGTVVATDTLAQLGAWAKESEAKSNVATAIKAAATQLGNRPATCRKYYVHPMVPERYLAGELLRQIAEARKQKQSTDFQHWLAAHEQEVLGLLRLAAQC